MLSSQHAQTSWRFHYVAVIVPVLWWASVLGMKRLLAAPRVQLPTLATLALPAACLGAGYAMGPIPWWSHLPAGADAQAGRYSPDRHDAAARRAVGTVPSDAAVSVSNLMGSHLANHRRVALFPRVGPARFVVVDRRNPSVGEVNGRGSPKRMEAVGRQMDSYIAGLLQGRRWRIRFAQDGAVVLERRPNSRAQTRTR
jgi:hypothetical protein